MSSVEIDGRRLALTNLDKVLWPQTGHSKGWLIDYYARVAPVLLPHLEARPLTIRRFPDGIGGISWHQNECRGQPDWFRVFETRGRGDRQLEFCVVDDLASLVWLANQAALELHPFQWSTDNPRAPSGVVFDLDPGEPADLVDCARVALALRTLLDELGLASFAKSSGSLGLHVHVPLGRPHDGNEVKAFARTIAEHLSRARPDVLAVMDKTERRGKVFVDWLQNDPTRQTVAPYSLRGMPFPTVATPLDWDEIERASAERRAELLTFLGDDVVERIERRGDLFACTLQLRQALPV